MTNSFAVAARRWQALAAQALGWRPGEFWQATPAEFAGCLMPPDERSAPLGRADLDQLMDTLNG